jgi:hypothetical protein
MQNRQGEGRTAPSQFVPSDHLVEVSAGDRIAASKHRPGCHYGRVNKVLDLARTGRPPKRTETANDGELGDICGTKSPSFEGRLDEGPASGQIGEEPSASAAALELRGSFIYRPRRRATGAEHSG